jgi:hypothetical protein
VVPTWQQLLILRLNGLRAAPFLTAPIARTLSFHVHLIAYISMSRLHLFWVAPLLLGSSMAAAVEPPNLSLLHAQVSLMKKGAVFTNISTESCSQIVHQPAWLPCC